MNRNFDYMRGELLQVQRNQQQIMENFGIPFKRTSILEKKRMSRFHEEIKKFQAETEFVQYSEKKNKNETKPYYVINCNGKTKENYNKRKESYNKIKESS